MRTTYLAFSLALQALCSAQSSVIDDSQAHTDKTTRIHSQIVFADIDNDGAPDLLNSYSMLTGRMQVFRNRGDGVFKPFAGQSAWLPLSLEGKFAVGDLNGDGNLDVVICQGGWSSSSQGQTTMMMLGDGTGNFIEASAAKFTAGTGSQRGGVVIVDVDLDGDLDFICGSLYLNDGTGGFRDVSATHLSLWTKLYSGQIISLDLTGNGYPDLYLDGRTYVNDGTGRFSQLQTDLPGGPTVHATGVPWGSADGLLFGTSPITGGRYFDPVTTQYFLPSIGVGTLIKAFSSALPHAREHTRGFAWGDLNGDGTEDLAIAVSGQNRILLNLAGVYVDVTSLSLPARLDATSGVSIADLDGDGDLDLGFANAPGRVYILLNDGMGRFTSVDQPRIESELPGWRTHPHEGSQLIDVDSDGDLDYVDSSALLVNDGTGKFVRDTRPYSPLIFSVKLSDAGDYDGDGDVDLAVFGEGAEPLRFVLNDGTGSFVVRHRRTLLPVSGVTSMAEGDVDGDGDTDFVYSGSTSGGQVWSPLGYIAISAVSLRVPVKSTVKLVDLDRDGDLDLLSWTGGKTIVHDNDGAGVFTPSAPLPFEVAQFGDIDGDGFVDLLSSQLHLNDGSGGFKPPVPVHARYSSPWTERLVDYDGDGDLDIFVVGGGAMIQFKGTEHILYENDGRGQFRRIGTGWYECVSFSCPPSLQQYGDIDQDGDLDFVRADRLASLPIRKVLVNALRHLESPLLPRVGKSLDYIVRVLPGRAPRGLVATILVSNRRLPSPKSLGALGNIWLESLFIATPNLLSIPSPRGSVTARFAIPKLPSLIGVDVHAQALIVDLMSGAGMHLTNLVSQTLSH